MAIEIRRLDEFDPETFRKVVTGYASEDRYNVERTETADGFTFRLHRVALEQPFVKEFPRLPEDLRRYQEVVRLGWSLGAYDQWDCVGLAIAEPRAWNRSLWIWELGVAATHRRRGIGRQLLGTLSQRTGEAGLRVLVCETQTTNVPAIDFYRKVGFDLEGVDLSYYTNEDVEKGEVALFMKRRLEGR